MKNIFQTLFIAQSFLFSSVCGAAYFLVDTTEKCFTVEQPRDTPLVFEYEIVDSTHIVGFDLFYGTQALSELRIKHQVLDTAKGEIEYTTDNDGYFCYCVHQISTGLNQPTRLRLRLKYGFDNNHYIKLVKEKNFDAVNLEVHKLNDFLTMTLNEADFQKHKEVDYHAQTEKMNSAALWWPIVQIGILIVTGVFQVQHLKNFFKANKLI